MAVRGYLRNLPVDFPLSRVHLMQTVIGWLGESGPGRMVVTLNARMVMLALTNPAFGAVIQQADLVTVDGYGVARALQRDGYPAPVRVAGVDMVKELLAWSATRALTIFCYGGSAATAARLPGALRRWCPGLQIGGVYDGYGVLASRQQVEAELLRCKPQLLLVGLGSPRQEFFLAQILPHLSGTVGIGVGGTLDVLSGRRKEAPLWCREHGWEWLFRMIQQPRKLSEICDLFRFWQQFLRK